MVKVFTQQNIEDLPLAVQELISQRQIARKSRDFAKSDDIRRKLYELGYQINDNGGSYEVLLLGDSSKSTQNHYLVLFGSGETAPSSVDIYRNLFLSLGKKDISISLITTPAGFQPNVSFVYQEVKDFLIRSLPDFNLTINIISANKQSDANNQELVDQLDKTDVIFTGPGSPTYAVNNLRNSLLVEKIKDKISSGTTLILASAATAAFSKSTLPVYEIYKVGADLHWQMGINIFAQYGFDTVLPHFNNKEGGKNLDTSYCYLGKDRGKKLLSMLPVDERVIGIDEHTALIIDLRTGQKNVRGKGKVCPLSNI